MVSRLIIKVVGSVLSDGFFPYSKFNFGLALKKGLVTKPFFFKFFEGLETFYERKFPRKTDTKTNL